ncbi:uncharacterized protein [Musca autumnalis]|uniref:uncharacterized protein n=1 Tax=Musca autumnalis TaxID=221902 RepID=UPI003CF23648
MLLTVQWMNGMRRTSSNIHKLLRSMRKPKSHISTIAHLLPSESVPGRRTQSPQSERSSNTTPLHHLQQNDPFNEVVKDNMLVAIANEKEGKLSPITTAEWGTVETKLSELVMEHVLANEDSPVPHFDSSEVHRGYRVIKCMDDYSKEFLEKSIAKLSNAWDDISLKLIPAQEIPMRPRARVWLPKIECDGPKLLKCLAKMNKDVPMDEWSVIATEPPNNNSMSLVLSITEAGVEALERLGNKLFFGIREAKVKILRPHGPNGEDDEADIDDAGMLLDNMQLEGPPTSSPKKKMMFKVVQINLKHSRIASDNLRILLVEEDLDIGIIQEPYVYENEVKGLDNRGYKTIYMKDNV